MKKIINDPAQYTDDMLKGIYRAHADEVGYINDDLRCYCTKKKVPGKVAIISGGGTGHLPLFLGYVGENLLDGCAVGSVFQSPSAEQIYEISKEVEAGAGILYVYGNYTGDIMNFDMAAEMCHLDDIQTASIVGADDVNSNADVAARRGVAGIFFMYKCAGAKAAQMGTLDEVLAAESLETLLKDMPVAAGEEVALLINGLGATSIEELYILSNSVAQQLEDKGISIYRPFVGEYATSMEMMGASISIMKVDEETKAMLDMPVNTPFYCRK